MDKDFINNMSREEDGGRQGNKNNSNSQNHTLKTKMKRIEEEFGNKVYLSNYSQLLKGKPSNVHKIFAGMRFGFG